MQYKKLRNTIRTFFTEFRIYRNGIIAIFFHLFYSNFKRKKNKEIRKIIINSNINYYEKTCATLIDSLIKYGVVKEDIILMIGGHTQIEKSYYHGVETYFLDNNSIDYTALIGILETGLVDKIDHFFYIHDTTVINSKRFSSVFYKYPLKSNFTYSIGTFISMNIGFYSKGSLLKCKDIILSAKNTDYSYQAVYNSKALGVEMEDAIFKKNCEFHKTIFGGYSMPTIKQTIYVGQNRIEESFKYLGILKYKVNKNISDNFIISLIE